VCFVDDRRAGNSSLPIGANVQACAFVSSARDWSSAGIVIVAPASAAVWSASSTSSTYMNSPHVVAPISLGGLVANCGNGNERFSETSPDRLGC
jgi:hypothetical protein